MNPAAMQNQASDKQEEYECYRGLFTGMVSGRGTCMGLSVLLARGMKAWLMQDAARGHEEAAPCTETTPPGCGTVNELAILLATMIGGV